MRTVKVCSLGRGPDLLFPFWRPAPHWSQARPPAPTALGLSRGISVLVSMDADLQRLMIAVGTHKPYSFGCWLSLAVHRRILWAQPQERLRLSEALAVFISIGYSRRMSGKIVKGSGFTEENKDELWKRKWPWNIYSSINRGSNLPKWQKEAVVLMHPKTKM